MATAAPPGQEEAPAELEGLAVKAGSDEPSRGCYFYSSDSAAVPDGRPTVALSTLLTAQARGNSLRHSSIKLATKLVTPRAAQQPPDRSLQNYCDPQPQFMHIVVRATMAAILPVVSKRMVIPFLEGTVKIVILTAICRLVTPEKAKHYCIKFDNSNHIFCCGVTWRGEVRA